MSAKVATIERVEQAIGEIQRQRKKPTVDGVLRITGGSKTTVLSLFNEVMERRMSSENTNSSVSAKEAATRLDDAIQKLVKLISNVPAIFMVELKRQNDAVSYHHQIALGQAAAWRDEKIAQLETELKAASRAEEEARAQIRILEEKLVLADRFIAAIEREQRAAASQNETSSQRPTISRAINNPAEPPSTPETDPAPVLEAYFFPPNSAAATPSSAFKVAPRTWTREALKPSPNDEFIGVGRRSVGARSLMGVNAVQHRPRAAARRGDDDEPGTSDAKQASAENAALKEKLSLFDVIRAVLQPQL